MPNAAAVKDDEHPAAIAVSSGGIPLLDPAETNPGPPPGPYVPHAISPGPLWRDRKTIVRRLEACDNPFTYKRAGKIARCCLGAFLATRPEGELVIVPSVCRQRLCPVCSRARSARTQSAIESHLKNVQLVRMGTLTLKASDAPFRDVLDRLLECYRKLRESKLWKSCVRGAVGVVQVTRGRDNAHWHVHLHFVWAGDFIPHNKLREEWLRITGDSYVVSLNGQGTKRDAARYVSRYVASPNELTNWSTDALREYALGMTGRRTLITSGAWHGSKIGTSPKAKDRPQLTQICTVGELVTGHQLGIVECTEALCLLSRCGWIGAQLSPIQLSTPPPTTPAELESYRTALRDSAREAAQVLYATVAH